ncbi:hypothetical protein [uncultured Sphingomonas sp.]|uniref:hypothetical protein n=1 Tax=uncultured Sphingomonas sp. TaxID=158754 RepID=UPI0025FC9AB8|nr:hypothetical protein [uncultured Sphingomonas sp.]
MAEDDPGVQAAANLLHATIAALQGMGATTAIIEGMLMTFERLNDALIEASHRAPLNAAITLQRQILSELPR